MSEEDLIDADLDNAIALTDEQARSLIREYDGENYAEWPEYRDYVRHIRCIACQMGDGRDGDGDKIEEPEYSINLFRVADPHHVRSRGAGGPDAENLVPLCRVHHTEIGNDPERFQLHYNLDVRAAAKSIFEMFMRSIEPDELVKKAHAEHQMMLRRLYEMKHEVMLMGEYLCNMRYKKIDGKQAYKLLGNFDSFDAYVQAPINAGGLGISTRSYYRWMMLYKADKKLSTPEASLGDLGMAKAEAIIPLLRRATTEAERTEIMQTVEPMTTQDTWSYINRTMGRPDFREQAVLRIKDYLSASLSPLGVKVSGEELHKIARNVYGLVKMKTAKLILAEMQKETDGNFTPEEETGP